MEAYITKIKTELDERLAIHEQETHALRRFSLSKTAVKEAIEDLRDHIKQDDLNPENVDFYNRHWRPYFYGKLIYFTMCFDLESLKITYSDDEREELYRHKLKDVESFFRRFSSFCQFYYRGDFAREHSEAIDFMGHFTIEDVDHLPRYPIDKMCLLAACLEANEQYRTYLQRQLLARATTPGNAYLPQAKWKQTKTDLAEIIIALYEDQAIEDNGKPATFEYFRDLCQREWGVSLENISIMDNKMRTRKKSPTPYLDNLTRKFLERKDGLE
jgi:RteC protein